MQQEANRSKYQAGQVWSYKARLPDIGSTLTVVKVDSDPVLGNIIHIGVLDLNLQNPRVPGGITREFPHLPMSEEAVDQSVVNLIDENAELPDYVEGYNVWRHAFDKQEAGIFTLTVAECLDIVEQMLIGEGESEE